MNRRMWMCVLLIALLAVPVGGIATAQDDSVEIKWWSHWANEPNKRTVVETFVADYMAAHPNVKIELEWWDKTELYQALRNTFTAGQGFPDIFTMDSGADGADFVSAGWVLDLTPYVDFDTQVLPATAEIYSFKSLEVEGTFGIPLEFYYDFTLYNTAIFDELGIVVPEDYSFTVDEWLDVMRKCAESPYAPMSAGAGTGTGYYPGRWSFLRTLLAYAGPDDYGAYMRGEKNFDTPEVRRALEYQLEYVSIPPWPASYSTMSWDEMHVFFNNQEKACAMDLATWYTGRAFKPADQGGQAEDFGERTGMLRPVEHPDAAYNNMTVGAVGSGYAGASMSEYPEIVGDILSNLATPKYGALWVGQTASPTGVVYSVSDVESEYNWYFELLDEVYGGVNIVVVDTNPLCGEISTAISDVVGEAIPFGIITDVDDAIELLNEGLCR